MTSDKNIRITINIENKTDSLIIFIKRNSQKIAKIIDESRCVEVNAESFPFKEREKNAQQNELPIVLRVFTIGKVNLYFSPKCHL